MWGTKTYYLVSNFEKDETKVEYEQIEAAGVEIKTRLFRTLNMLINNDDL